MPKYYEDNFGFYSVEDDPEELAFLCHIRLSSRPKVCLRCNRKVSLRPSKQICAMCSDALEHGAPSSLKGYKTE
jgi:predicted amidophosphoribosyltransferase